MHFVDVKSILNNSGGMRGMNLYRGCSHGCIYCDSRSDCYQFSHDFEDIEVKQNAPELLETALSSMRARRMIGTGSMCDPYLPAEKELKLTRRCLEIIDRHGFGATVLTKSDLILRDLDILKSINGHTKCVVQMTLTTWDDELSRKLEPNVCTTRRRLEVLETMRDSGIPTFVWLSPILPFINDTRENIEAILDGCVRAGVKGIVCFGMGLTLRDGNREYFYEALDRSFPGLKTRYIKTYGNSYNVTSPRNDELMSLFYRVCRENGMISDWRECFAWMNEFPVKEEQLSLF